MNTPPQRRRGIGASSRHAPAVPDLAALAPSDLKLLRKLFTRNRFADEPSVDDGIGPSVFKMLFARDLSIDPDLARSVFEPLDINSLIETGLLFKEEQGGIKACFQAQPYNRLIFFSDFIEWEDALDFVLPIGLAAHYLALLTIRRKTGTVLDLGCGCGIQALLAAQHSRRVTATDVNPRALALTRLNARLNGLRNIETLDGGYFEPVEASRFDLIVGNLPYVITPAWQFTYRDGDQTGDAGIYQWLEDMPAYLREGGMAHVLINWIHSEAGNWSEPLREALSGRGVDAWLIHNESRTPAEYSASWIDHRIRRNTTEYRRTKKSWMKWYEAHRIAHIALGALTLRRRIPRAGKQNWFEAAEVNTPIRDSAGEQYRRLFAVRDRLETFDDPDALLNEKLRRFDLAISVQVSTAKPIAYATKGLRLENEIHPNTAAVLDGLDGKTLLRIPMASIAPSQAQTQVLQELKSMMRLGMVVPQSFHLNRTLSTKRHRSDL